MEPIEVVARFDLEGWIIPERFTWRGSGYRVASIGRQWQDDQGRHILVMDPGERVFEITFVPQECRWYLEDEHSGQKFA